jgi:hypothetical protein
MGDDTLEDPYKGLEDVIILGIRPDKTVNMSTSLQDLTEIQSVLNTALLMVLYYKSKDSDGVDRMH